jgi:hypothetical protein
VTDAELESLAERATPGPWGWEAHGEKSNDWTVGVALDKNDQPLSGEIREPDFIVETVGYSEPWVLRKKLIIEHENAPGYSDAAFIAAASPDVVLALIRRAQEAEARANKLAQHLMEVTAELDETP